MDSNIIIYAVYAAGVAILLCLGLYIRRKRGLRLVELDRSVKTDPYGDTLDDDFYCIMRKDGSTSGGFIPRK
ncbi:MAG: hypothetical protein R8K20_09530 [Gallionellaceae bacterium]